MSEPNPPLETLRALIEHATGLLRQAPSHSKVASLAERADVADAITALRHLLNIVARSPAPKTADIQAGARQLAPGEVSEIGEQATGLLIELGEQAAAAGQDEAKVLFENASYPLAIWIAEHDGEIRILEPVVNTLATLTNHTHDRAELESIHEHMRSIVHAVGRALREEDTTNPARPWRVLNLNWAITATRTHNPQLMEESFGQLVHNIPNDAKAFFTEGMQQMDALDYPDQVREVMERYFREWIQPKTVH